VPGKRLTYKDAGVDIDAGEESVRRIRNLVATTFTPGVLQGIGHFGAMFELPLTSYREPVFISSVDGVGTKLKIAIMMNKHDTIGEDLVNHCVNDIFTTGAQPLFFLDYLSLGKVDPKVVEQLIAGMVRGCKNANCALIGGETAEMTDLYQSGDYDIAGTIVGVVEKSKLIKGNRIQAGDRLIGIGSNGLHTNGYTLARKIFFEICDFTVDQFHPQLQTTIGEALLQVHRNYFPVIAPLLEKYDIHGMAHITGGGIVGNTSRIIPAGLQINIDWSAWKWLPIFQLLQQLGTVPLDDMKRTFNLGIGFILVVPAEIVTNLQVDLLASGEDSYQVGEVVHVSQ